MRVRTPVLRKASALLKAYSGDSTDFIEPVAEFCCLRIATEEGTFGHDRNQFSIGCKQIVSVTDVIDVCSFFKGCGKVPLKNRDVLFRRSRLKLRFPLCWNWFNCASS